MMQKIKYDKHECKKRIWWAQKMKEETVKKRTTKSIQVDFSWQRQNMSMTPLFVTTQSTLQPRYTQSQVAFYLSELQKSFHFTQANLVISRYIERVPIFAKNKANNFGDKSNMVYYENISYFDCTMEKTSEMNQAFKKYQRSRKPTKRIIIMINMSKNQKKY